MTNNDSTPRSKVSGGSYTLTEEPTVEEIAVLAVDDDPDLLDLTATFLEREQGVFDVRTETRADKALTQLKEDGKRTDVIVSDYDMPGMDGLEFLEAVREQLPAIPFILFTGKGSEEIASEAISAGVTDYLQKGTDVSKYSVLANRLVNSVEQYRAREELKRSEAKFSKLVENSTDLISIVSEEGRFEYVSPSCEHIIGYSQDKLVGDSVFNYVHPEDRQKVMERFFESVENPDIEPTITFRLNHPERDWTVLESRGRNLLSDDDLEGFVVNTRDITELKEREQELEQRNKQLENIQHTISHDIRNPLTVAQNSLTLFAEDGDESHLERAETAMERIDTLIDQTETLTNQRVKITDTEAISLNEAIESAWEMVSTADATLHVDDSKQLEADPARLQQLLENLIHNAVVHGPKDVTCSVGTLESGIYIEDTGPGIPEEERDLVFESGFTTSEDNTGFGLTIVKQIVIGHGWEIDVTEGTDGGARFEITGVTFQPTVYN